MSSSMSSHWDYECIPCRREFVHWQAFRSHLEHAKIHSPPYCQLCKKHFQTVDELEKHIDLHDDDRWCDLCERLFTTPLALAQHMRDSARHRNVCTICKGSFQSQSDLDQHRNALRHWPLFHCRNCNLSFSYQDGIDDHFSRSSRCRPLPTPAAQPPCTRASTPSVASNSTATSMSTASDCHLRDSFRHEPVPVAQQQVGYSNTHGNAYVNAYATTPAPAPAPVPETVRVKLPPPVPAKAHAQTQAQVSSSVPAPPPSAVQTQAPILDSVIPPTQAPFLSRTQTPMTPPVPAPAPAQVRAQAPVPANVPTPAPASEPRDLLELKFKCYLCHCSFSTIAAIVHHRNHSLAHNPIIPCEVCNLAFVGKVAFLQHLASDLHSLAILQQWEQSLNRCRFVHHISPANFSRTAGEVHTLAAENKANGAYGTLKNDSNKYANNEGRSQAPRARISSSAHVQKQFSTKDEIELKASCEAFLKRIDERQARYKALPSSSLNQSEISKARTASQRVDDYPTFAEDNSRWKFRRIDVILSDDESMDDAETLCNESPSESEPRGDGLAQLATELSGAQITCNPM